MKKGINILCALILLLVIASGIQSLFSLGFGFTAGYNMAMETETDKTPNALENGMPYTVAFFPTGKKGFEPKDSLQSAVGKVPLTYKVNIVYPTYDNIPSSAIILSLCFSTLTFILCVPLLICFIKFIININKNRIFYHKNIRLLRLIGISLLCIATFQIAYGLIEEWVVNSLELVVSGYTPLAYWSIPWSNFIMGLSALLLSLIWAKAIKLYEENAYTI